MKKVFFKKRDFKRLIFRRLYIIIVDRFIELICFDKNCFKYMLLYFCFTVMHSCAFLNNR